MDNEIQLISDGDGLAVIGNPTDVDRFLTSEGLSSKDLGLQRLKSVAGTGAGAAQAGSEIAANSGRWVQLTQESARLVEKYGLRESSKTGLSTGVVKGQKGQVRGFLEFVKGPRSLLTNPAALAGAARIMTQVAMQQTMDEITDYLATIDEKVDDVLRAQKDAALARMIGVGFVIEEAMTLREKRGRVDEVTWSKVQAVPATIAETQAYALRQLDALAQKMELKTKIGDLAEAAREAESGVREWLAVLARCFQLQDAIAVLELDRVLDASPEELHGHRLGLKAARQARLEHISRSTQRLVARMNAAAGAANAKVLLHPAKSPAVVQSSNDVATGVHDFHGRLGITSGRRSSEARRWADAATEAKDKALAAGAKGVDAARALGSGTLDRAGSVKGRLSDGIAERTRRRRGDAEG
ncbi:hypothetical protein ACFRSX_14595 [Streptomyces goshikiensis]|uniref:hypothetical protein n=1 Tax=Streptomyces TaxID=1883 RepID=UPI000C276BEE|nr:hypothetical protein [Streptomyces sp. CB02120-2]PJN14155.1 hypothetical protein CG724_35345 [Streptomyces sp. CB02120-2]